MKNKLSDLNNHLFEQLERLNDDELMEESLEQEIARSKALTTVAQQIINNGNLMLNAQKYADEFGYNSRSGNMPDLLKLESKNEK